MSSSSLIQSNVGANGNFYVVAVMRDGTLAMFWRNNDDPSSLFWAGAETFGANAGSTPPTMIQTTTGTVDESAIGDFDVLVVVGGRVEHYRRNNDDFRAHRQPQNGPGAAWSLVDSFGRSANDLVYVWSFTPVHELSSTCPFPICCFAEPKIFLTIGSRPAASRKASGRPCAFVVAS